MKVEVSHSLRFWKRDGEVDRLRLEKQYADLLSEFGPSLGRLVASYENGAQAKEDLLQDINLAIWVALPRFRGEASLRTFVFRIAHNRASTHAWRRGQSLLRRSLDEIDIEDPRSNMEKDLIEATDRERLLSAIRSLPMPMMQVLSLALEDISHREIAEILGTNENNVAVRLNRARALLRQRLGAQL